MTKQNKSCKTQTKETIKTSKTKAIKKRKTPNKLKTNKTKPIKANNKKTNQ